tara:strand:- start:275 stop:691 length:417 start_codon:yes stop_codon:yes gene_type:complete
MMHARSTIGVQIIHWVPTFNVFPYFGDLAFGTKTKVISSSSVGDFTKTSTPQFVFFFLPFVQIFPFHTWASKKSFDGRVSFSFSFGRNSFLFGRIGVFFTQTQDITTDVFFKDGVGQFVLLFGHWQFVNGLLVGSNAF